MLKKLVIAAAAVVVGLVILKMTYLGSLFQVWWKDSVAFCQKQIPPETRLKQLRIEIGKIDTDIGDAIDKLLRGEIEHKKLKDNVAGLKAKQEQRARDMKTLTAALKENRTLVTFNDQSLSAETAQSRLRSLTAQLKSGKEELRKKEEGLAVLGEQVELLDEQINKLKNDKEELLARADKMDADLIRLRTRELDSGIKVSDTQTTKAKALADLTEDQIELRSKRAEKYAHYGLTPALARVKAHGNKEDVIKAAEEELARDGAQVVGKE